MRLLAWLCVVAGLLIAGAWPVYVEMNERSVVATYGPVVLRVSEDSADGSGIPGGPWQQERAIALQRVREARALSPWPGVIAGVGVAAFGVLLLAIRRPVTAPAAVVAILLGATPASATKHLDQFGVEACATFSRAMTDFGNGNLTEREVWTLAPQQDRDPCTRSAPRGRR